MLTAKDIMSREVFTVREETSVEELARLFSEKGVNAMPVVDDRQRLMGIVTATDLVKIDKPLHVPTVVSLFDWVLYIESEKNFREEVRKVTARRVAEICTREVVTCTPETSVGDIAAIMVEKGVHLLPVVEGGKVVGVVGRFDIIRSMGH
jgi:CBS-domain-containing membrane protein